MEDEPVVKPRRARGTPFLQFRHRIAVGFVVVTYVLHSIVMHIKKDETRRKFAVGWFDESETSRNRRAEYRSNLPFHVGKDFAYHQKLAIEGMAPEELVDSPLESDLGD